MRTLPAALLAAQRSDSAVPYLKAVVHDRIGGIRRLDWKRLYTGSEPDGYHAATMPGDSGLLRARVSGGRLYYQRVPGPGTLSDYSTWTDLAACANAGVALSSDGARALLFYVDTNGTTLKVRESTDNGSTLGAAVTVATAGSAVTWLAADVKSNGDAVLLYSAGATVYNVKRASGNWGSPSAWSNSVASVTGLACYYQGDWNAVVCGTNAAGEAYVWSCVFGDGFLQAANTWSALREVTRASAGSNVGFRAPFLSQPDTYRATFVEKYTGSAAYNRPQHTYTPASADYTANLWREPVPFDLATDYGQALAFSATAAWLCTPYGVWKADMSAPGLDITADIIEAETLDRPFAGRMRLVLRNDGGLYAGPPPPIRPGAEVRVSPGYRTASGPLASDGPAYWIDGVEYVTGGGESALVLEGRDAWGLLDAWRARRQHAWAAGEKSASGILQLIFARAGLEFASIGASTTSSNLFPAFTVSPGESGLTAVRRLLDKLPDVIFVRGEFAYLTEPLASEAADYSYGTDHRIIAGRYGDGALAANRAQVYGSGVFGERFDWPGVAETYDRLTQALDANLTTVAQAEGRADAMLRRAVLEATDGAINVPVNCGQELYDAIEIADTAAGMVAAKRRVLGLGFRYSAEKGVYEQRIDLGAP